MVRLMIEEERTKQGEELSKHGEQLRGDVQSGKKEVEEMVISFLKDPFYHYTSFQQP